MYLLPIQSLVHASIQYIVTKVLISQIGSKMVSVCAIGNTIIKINAASDNIIIINCATSPKKRELCSGK